MSDAEAVGGFPFTPGWAPSAASNVPHAGSNG